MKSMFAVLVVALLLLTLGQAAYACVCPELGPAQVLTREQEIEQILKSDGATVFTGEVTSINLDGDQPYFSDVTFRVDQYWAGIVPREIIVRAFRPDAACSVELRLGESYLMFAKAYQNAVYADECFGIKAREKASEDLNYLGKGKPPIVEKNKNN